MTPSRSHRKAPTGPVRFDHRNPTAAGLLVALQRSAYAVEAALVGSDAIPPLRERPDDVRALDLEVLAFVDQGRPVAAVGFRVDDGVLDVDRLVVDPAYARRGLGRRLMEAALDAGPHDRATVSTAQGNTPARRLYEGLGFEHVEDVAVLPDLTLSRYERPGG